jgi:hypothetical protein
MMVSVLDEKSLNNEKTVKNAIYVIEIYLRILNMLGTEIRVKGRWQYRWHSLNTTHQHMSSEEHYCPDLMQIH